MSQSQAKSSVVTYTSEEQEALVRLEDTARILKNTVLFLQNGLFQGKEGRAIVESGAFIEALFNQTQAQISEIHKGAQLRLNAPAPAAEPAKSDS